MEAQFPQPGEPISFYQMNPEFWTYQNRYQNNQFYDYFEPAQHSGIPSSNGTSSDSGSSSEDEKTRFQETGVDESEAVDELLQILVECLKKADIRTREVLLRKFFFEIEKEMALEGFLVERIKHSKIQLFSESLERNPWCSQDSDRFFGRDVCNAETGKEISVLAKREVDVSSGEETSKKLERFKVKTVQVGEIVKEEAE